MDMDFIKLMIEKYGTKGLIVALVLLGLMAFFKSKAISDAWSKVSDKLIEWFLKNKTKPDEIRSIVESDILNHDIFSYIDYWSYSKVPTFQFSTEYRTVVFKKYLTILVQLLSIFIQSVIPIVLKI